MSKNKFEEHFLESFVDVATELLAYNKHNSNPPTPSLNDFSKADSPEQEIVITNEEAEQILSILNNLQDELEMKEEKINQLQGKVNKNKSNAQRTQKKNKKSKHSFKADLIEHAETLDLVTVLIQSGSNCCELTGNLFRVYHDFIILLNEVNQLIKIKIDKIAAIKMIDSNKQKKKKCRNQSTNKSDENDASSNNDNLTEEVEKDLHAV